MNWSDPAARLALIESVGLEEYNRRIAAHLQANVIEVRNGYELRKVDTQWGELIHVSPSNSAFRTLDQAQAFADGLPTRE